MLSALIIGIPPPCCCVVNLALADWVAFLILAGSWAAGIATMAEGLGRIVGMLCPSGLGAKPLRHTNLVQSWRHRLSGHGAIVNNHSPMPYCNNNNGLGFVRRHWPVRQKNWLVAATRHWLLGWQPEQGINTGAALVVKPN